MILLALISLLTTVLLFISVKKEQTRVSAVIGNITAVMIVILIMAYFYVRIK